MKIAILGLSVTSTWGNGHQRFNLNITRADLIKTGYSPSVRLFEAAACGVPVISDWWEGIDSIFTPGEAIFISRSPNDTIEILNNISERHRLNVGEKAKQTVLKQHTGLQRAIEFEEYVSEASLKKRHKEQVHVTEERVYAR